MGQSIAAKYAARPAAKFVRPSTRARERRLGLGASGSFFPATRQVTELRGSASGPVSSRRDPRHGTARPSRLPIDGRPRPTVRMRWTSSSHPAPGRRASASPAPWRA
jgi:hypothetical protein